MTTAIIILRDSVFNEHQWDILRDLEETESWLKSRIKLPSMSIVCSIKECVCMLFLGRRRAHFYCSLCRVWMCVVGLCRLTCRGFVQGQCFSFVWHIRPHGYLVQPFYTEAHPWDGGTNSGCVCSLKKKKKGKPWLSHLHVVQHGDSQVSGASCIRGVMYQGS